MKNKHAKNIEGLKRGTVEVYTEAELAQKFTEAGYEGPKRILDINYLMNNHPDGKTPISEAIY